MGRTNNNEQDSKSARTKSRRLPTPPEMNGSYLIHGDQKTLTYWLLYYWPKFNLPMQELDRLAITQDRQEYIRWMGKRLQHMVIGCYCYVTLDRGKGQEYWHIIFIEPNMQPKAVEVTLAHELIHMADRVKGIPRKHHHHGYDSIAVDEAALTGCSMEELRALVVEASKGREQALRTRNPIRYIYECPGCGMQYPRTRRYSSPVSCSQCDKKDYNPLYRLRISNAEPA